MLRGKTISLIIPCYNEEEGLPHVLSIVPDWVDEVIVVDNNSTDFTARVAKEKGAKVFPEKNKGYGYAYMKGFSEARGEIYITMDGDGTYPIDQIEKLTTQLLEENLDFISACRFPLMNKKNMDPVSKVGNFILTLVTKILFGVGLKDSQSGMWVFRKAILEKLRLESGGMAFSEEIKLEVIRRKMKFKEVHIPYYERYGEKKIKKFRDGMYNLWYLMKLRFRKLN